MQAKDNASLADELASCKAIDRDLDARIAVALYSDTGHADDRDNTRALLPAKFDECTPGTYWVSAFSGLSLRTAPGFTGDKLLRDLAISALRRQQSGEAVEQSPLEASPVDVERVAEAIFDVIWPSSYWEGDGGTCKRASEIAARAAIAAFQSPPVEQPAQAEAFQRAMTQAAEAAAGRALEAAAKVAENEGADPNWHPLFRRGCRVCANAIRSLDPSQIAADTGEGR